MTPGRYIRDERERLGLSVEDVALRLDSDPPVCARDRAELLAAIEADAIPLSPANALALTDAMRTIGLRELSSLAHGPGHGLRLFTVGPGPVTPLLVNQGGEASA